MKKLERLLKRELIEYITTIRPKADAYDRVCGQLGIKNNILGFVKNLTIPRVRKSCFNRTSFLAGCTVTSITFAIIILLVKHVF